MGYSSTRKASRSDGASTARSKNSLVSTTLARIGGIAPKSADRLWRITCFVVDRKHRQRGVTWGRQRRLERRSGSHKEQRAKSKEQRVKSKGGGVVEAYPMTHRESCAFWQRVHSRSSVHVREEGITVVAPLGATKFSERVLVRRTV